MATPEPGIPAYDPGLFRSRVTWIQVVYGQYGPPAPHSAGQTQTGQVNRGNKSAYIQPMGGREIEAARKLAPTTTGRVVLRFTPDLADLMPGDKLVVIATSRELVVTWRYRELEQGSGGYLVIDYAEPIRRPPP